MTWYILVTIATTITITASIAMIFIVIIITIVIIAAATSTIINLLLLRLLRLRRRRLLLIKLIMVILVIKARIITNYHVLLLSLFGWILLAWAARVASPLQAARHPAKVCWEKLGFRVPANSICIFQAG